MRGDIFVRRKKRIVKEDEESFYSSKPNQASKNDNKPKSSEKKSSKSWLIILIVVILFIGLPIIYYFYAVNVPKGGSNENVAFEIIDGETTLDIAERLKKKDLIHNNYTFALYVYLRDLNLIPGIYYLKKNMNLSQLLKPMSQGNIQEYKITIIEGWRREQIAQMLAENNIVNYEDFMKVSEGKEGYLFPDTYRLSIDITAAQIVNKLIENFNTRTSNLKVSSDDIILASIVEREAQKNEDRSKIAGVYKNRLDTNMRLEADPTVQYTKGTNWPKLKLADYKSVDSLYNTYLHKGLPPGPICNPGLASIKAVLNAEKNGYYYFLHLDDGTTLFAETLEEHNLNKQKK